MDNIYYNDMMIEADRTNWREATELIIGEEPVNYALKTLAYSRPIIRISSEEKSALDRVLDAAIDHSENVAVQ